MRARAEVAAPGRGAVARQPAPHVQPLAAEVHALQRSAGNRAVCRVLARTVLDQDDPLAAWRRLTPAFRFTKRGSKNPELMHVDDLLQRLRSANTRGGNESFRTEDILRRLQKLLREWAARGARDGTLKDRGGALRILAAEVDARLGDSRFTTDEPDWIDESWGGVTAPTSPLDPTRDAMDEYLLKGGMPDPLKQTYLDDYKRIRALLVDKRAVWKHWRMLEDRLREGWTLSHALKHYEDLAGFTRIDVIPLGLLDTPTFLGMIRGGVAFKDFGAGIKHGEWTHRLQWFAIAAEITNGFTTDKAPGWNHTPIELYKYLASPDMQTGHGRYKKALFGSLFDLGGSQTLLYNHPDQINQDLIGVKSWYGVEDARLKGADYTVLEQHLVPQRELPLLGAAMLEKTMKRAREAAAGTTLDQYRAKKEGQATPYTRDPGLSGAGAGNTILSRPR